MSCYRDSFTFIYRSFVILLIIILSRKNNTGLRFLRRTFGPKEEEVTGGSRKLYNEKLPNLYHSTNIGAMK
jgi:hypothetical protein